jgi:transcriptional regulator with XRE-family HTH domain
MKLNGAALRVIRTGQGLSLRDLAELTGLSIGFLSRVETDQKDLSNEETIKTIAKALRVDVEAISSPTLLITPNAIRRIVELLGAPAEVIDEVMAGVGVG